MIKNKKLLFAFTTITSAVAISIPITTTIIYSKEKSLLNDAKQQNSDSNNKNHINSKNNDITNESNNSKVDEVKKLIPNETNYFNPRLSTKNGPITFWGNTITSVDWFGGERWSIDVTNIQIKDQKPFATVGIVSWKRNWLNFDLDKKSGMLYILNNAAPNTKQKVVSIDTNSGNVKDVYELNQVTPNSKSNYKNRYYTLSVLDNGNVLVYGQQGHAISKSDLIDIKSGTVTESNGNLSTISKIPNGEQYKGSTNYLMNLIPIGNNRNIAVTYNMTSRSSTSNDDGRQGDETSKVEFILCDDKMNIISDALGGWDKPKEATRAIKNTMNSKIWPQRDWYKLLDGRIVTIIYDKLFVINPNDSNNPSFTKFTLDDDKWIESWSFDTNEKLYFKSKGATNIQTITLDSNKNGNNHTKGIYYDLKNSPLDEIKNNASSFTLFNVYGYSGQIMIINSKFHEFIDTARLPSNEEIEQNYYGLAAAITSNANAAGQGDTKGLLNTNKAFQKSADFTIESNVLSSKLPSEITRDDLKLLNNSFFANRNDKNDNGTLKYEPFIKTKMDDINKEIEVQVNIDQIPWFVTNNVMPEDIKPLTIKKSFKSTININDRFIWKQSNIDDYDFKNTLPSKLTIQDIERISPLISTLSSQKARIDNIEYPKTNYSFISQDDTSGKVKIKAEYEYLPMDTKRSKDNIKKYTLEHEYQIFKSSNAKTFKFVGTNDNSEDINNIPALKELKEANLFPSYFKTANKQEFLKFIDVSQTAGYPLEKMKITVNDNDSNGTLSVTVDPTSYDSSLPIKTKIYSGLNKIVSYKFSFIEPSKEKFNKENFRPSDITSEHIFSNFVSYSGFDSSDLSVQLIPNNLNGTLSLNIFVNSSYPTNVLTSNGFKLNNDKYVITKQINNFKNDETFNKEYQLTYKDSSSSDLLKFKEFTPAFIKEKLSTKNLEVAGVRYDDEYKFAKEFVSSYGSKLPTIDTKTNINLEIFYNNSGGEITFNITYQKLDGYPNPITFIQKFSGFAKGNDVITKDVLTFKDSSQLKLTNPKYFEMLPSEVKKELKDSPSKILDFILGKATGSYATAISSNNFKLEISYDDNYGTLTINIKFERKDVADDKSLLEYSQTFSGFKSYE